MKQPPNLLKLLFYCVYTRFLIVHQCDTQCTEKTHVSHRPLYIVSSRDYTVLILSQYDILLDIPHINTLVVLDGFLRYIFQRSSFLYSLSMI